MASSSKEKAFWSSEDVETFCKLCVEQIDNGNRPATNKRDGWTVIIKKFEELRGKKYEKNQMKSKWDNLKEEWKRWRALILKETGLGWDAKKNTIDASDEWWEKKIQENPKARAFRTKGIHPDIQVLLDRMFGDTVATGSVTWNPAQGLYVDEDVVATQLDIDDCSASNDDTNVECNVREKGQSYKRSSSSSVKHSQVKKQKKMSSSAKLTSQMDIIASAIASRSNATTCPMEFNPYREIVQTLKDILEINQDKELYFFALDYLLEKKDNRLLFSSLDGNEERLQWIKYKFTQRTLYNKKAKIRSNQRFYPHFKDCIGAIDGTHIPAVVPIGDQLRFIGRKGTPTQNILAVCNFNMEFTYVLAGWEGSAHDTRIFYEAIRRRDLQFPHPPKGKYYLVDSGYPNPIGYLGPYKEVRYHLPEFQRGPNPTGYKEVFNRAHSSLRSEIERAFGVLKKKWKILKSMPSYPYQKQVKIVVAAMTLHNYVRRNAVNDAHFARVDLDPNLYAMDLNDEESSVSNEDVTFDMARLRDQIATNLGNI